MDEGGRAKGKVVATVVAAAVSEEAVVRVERVSRVRKRTKARATGMKEDDGENGEEESEDEADSDGEADPNESHEERSRRLLNENQDLEKGALSPGRREIRDPEKDY